MTKEEKIEAFAMRLDGYTLQQIGDRFGVTREYIRQVVGNSVAKENREKAAIVKQTLRDMQNERKKALAETIVFPGVREWAITHHSTPCKIASGICADGTRRASVVQALTKQNQKHGPCLDIIKNVLEFTGLTFEQAFSEEVAP